MIQLQRGNAIFRNRIGKLAGMGSFARSAGVWLTGLHLPDSIRLGLLFSGFLQATTALCLRQSHPGFGWKVSAAVPAACLQDVVFHLGDRQITSRD